MSLCHEGGGGGGEGWHDFLGFRRSARALSSALLLLVSPINHPNIQFLLSKAHDLISTRRTGHVNGPGTRIGGTDFLQLILDLLV